jgi:hypothetical protein
MLFETLMFAAQQLLTSVERDDRQNGGTLSRTTLHEASALRRAIGDVVQALSDPSRVGPRAIASENPHDRDHP